MENGHVVVLVEIEYKSNAIIKKTVKFIRG